MQEIQKNISNFIESQFPALYHEGGETFIEFVKAYYRWMETSQLVDNAKFTLGTISVQAQNNTIIGSNTSFTSDLSANQVIAIWKNNEYYNLYTVNSVTDDTTLTVTAPIQFTNTVTYFANTKLAYNPTYYQRHLLEMIDVDNTTDQFMVYFKETYLKDIQFDTQSDVRLLLKHTLDLYRSKGTPQAVALLFRIVFGTDVEMYYPGDDLFRLSDGIWKKPQYIELSLGTSANLFVGKQIVGETSKATAYAEKLVRRKINGRLIDELYITNVAGTFKLGEKINLDTDPIDIVACPIMIGSLTNLEVNASGVGDGFAVGDLVDVYSVSGGEAVARVSSVLDVAGVIGYDLDDGGYAYTANAEVYISEQTFIVNSVHGSYSIYNDRYFQPFETIGQNTANIAYVAATGEFTPGTNVYTYHANNLLKGVGVVMNVSSTNSTVGSMLATPISGNIESTAIFTVSNAVTASVNVISGIVWTNATARVLEVSNAVTLYANVTSTFNVTDTVVQLNDIGIATAIGTVTEVVPVGNGLTALTITRNGGKFVANNTISSATGSGNLVSIALSVSVVNVTSSFNNQSYNIMTGATTNGSIVTISSGSDANVSLGPTLLYSEVVSLNSDIIANYVTMELANVAFGFPASPTGNLTSGTITSMLTFANVTIGKIGSILTAPGTGYTARPVVRIIEPKTYPYRKLDVAVSIANSTSGFLIDEVVTQSATGARGLVKQANSTRVLVQRLRWEDAANFVVTTNSTTTFVGVTSGAVANITAITSDVPPELGINANVVTSLAVAVGAINGLQVIESGYGFMPDEIVTIRGADGRLMPAFANVYTIGTGRGYYQKQGGFLSDRKKLHDGYYYQNYSYDVRSSIVLSKYEQMLKKVVHAAGTKMFGTFIQRTTIGTTSSFEPASIVTS